MTDLANVHVRFGLLISIAVAVMGGVWTVAWSIAELNSKVEQVWQINDMSRWCAKATTANQGWKCPDPFEVRTR